MKCCCDDCAYGEDRKCGGIFCNNPRSAYFDTWTGYTNTCDEWRGREAGRPVADLKAGATK